jgi:hypothetical protein
MKTLVLFLALLLAQILHSDQDLTTGAFSVVDMASAPPEITIMDGEVRYVFTRIQKETITTLTYVSDYSATLQKITLIVSHGTTDYTLLLWTLKDDLVTRERSKDLKWCKDFFRQVAFKPFKIKPGYFQMTTEYGNALYETEPQSQYDRETDSVTVLSKETGKRFTIPVDDFYIQPPRFLEGRYRIGVKMGKLSPLVEREGRWYVPVSEYYGFPTSVASD